MNKVISLGVLLVLILTGWGLSALLSKPIDLDIPNVSHEEAGVFGKNVILRGREEGNISWEIKADDLKIDLSYKNFYFKGNIEGKVYRGEKLSIDVKGDSAEINMDKGVLVFPKGVDFQTEDGYKGTAPYAVWYMSTKEFICSKGRVKFEKIGEFKAEADFFRFSSKEGIAVFEGNVVIETGI
ncbi:MAG: hypothetical protein CBR30_02870 [Dictyoglomus sp. NZ13-RE01]|nr:MAG: hypothetical protein CBR30_02870 [Dictyoglomus sp. NZ13-RE01]